MHVLLLHLLCNVQHKSLKDQQVASWDYLAYFNYLIGLHVIEDLSTYILVSSLIAVAVWNILLNKGEFNLLLLD